MLAERGLLDLHSSHADSILGRREYRPRRALVGGVRGDAQEAQRLCLGDLLFIALDDDEAVAYFVILQMVVCDCVRSSSNILRI